jgi:acyl-CoA thioesterase-1
MKIKLVLVLLLLTAQLASAQDANKKAAKPKRKVNPVFAPVKDDPNLPRVLLIGDSISIGYTLPVRKLLAGKANVHRPPTNCGPTTRGLEQIDSWLGDGKWDVIHFNFGLHDLKYLGPQGQNLADPKAPNSKQQVPPDEYEKNLRQLVKRMQKTGATLIWRSTTPVPQGAKGRVVGHSAKYNEIAKRVMADADVTIDDMYAYSKPRLKKIQRPANVHFTPAGSSELAAGAVKAISKALK